MWPPKSKVLGFHGDIYIWKKHHELYSGHARGHQARVSFRHGGRAKSISSAPAEGTTRAPGVAPLDLAMRRGSERRDVCGVLKSQLLLSSTSCVVVPTTEVKGASHPCSP